ncbi:MAG: hypothetical protein A2418_02680 [Candidatus Brennerbacteria bacterium RIFOXYC1_FULL_41_11]|uniref:J domain-containing protein n=1 Tax=Candidatus Brennerbacteria bacterium RIFOXYD1_FULL_41_16 TaxID=1797529 RepID=A0A1G1XJQ5_9BACT|nr:MAG: Chaperone protein DnaJ [Parcubacteria group bacterium GW2011_GWB1_41_4]OGY38802.1 MAG: hypothetical protein A2391_02435 [Candidatus Brennerbacteria bacterium RIFOXYB1_FULL_41_13]OGY39085.1 MAG: hypothetical protein A2418_02680 [Candidatus Brennerbacteria bacterium RIFOXYC1_FULL_41_11]OGY40238.1 MAG: hypothetical protein A2570_03060 [Candidatus Brennerbacteria bacterium RIFOXYD1_FULL_41_16]
MKDFYKILGVSENSSSEEIKKAYRNLAHKHHPDKSSGDEAKFKEINEAYQTLSDAGKKQQYDAMRKYGGGFSSSDSRGFGYDPFGFSSGGFSWQGGLDDLLSEFFGGMSGFSRSTGQRTRTQPKQVVTMSVQGPKGMNMTIQLSGVKGVNDKAKKIIEEFAGKLFRELE